MALPVILFNSSTGSDSQASGAGPSTALFGSTDASTDGTGLVVTVTAGTDLTNVATDGSHVIFFFDGTAGNRNFGKITGKAGSGGATPNVTVSDAFGLTIVNKSWAIGGKRLSIASTTSIKLLTNNAAAGDLMSGWIMELESGYTETIAATVDVRRNMVATTGGGTIRGASGTMPILTFSNNGNAFVMRGTYWTLSDFEMRNTNATKTASVAIIGSSGGQTTIERVVVSHSTDKFWKAMVPTQNGWYVRDCNLGFCANVAIDLAAAAANFRCIGNWIHDCTSHGINSATTATIGLLFASNLIETNGGDGLHFTDSGASAQGGGYYFFNNTIANNTSDGIEFTLNVGTSDRPVEQCIMMNNIFASNGGYGVNLSGTGWTDTTINQTMQMDITYNDFYNNTSGTLSGSGAGLTLDSTNSTANPTFTDSANADYSIGVNLAGLGFPGSRKIGANQSLTPSAMDIGVSQRAASSGAAGGSYAFS